MFRYPGGKSKLSDIIISKIRQEIGFFDNKKDTYIEPFFGGGSIGLKVLKENTFKKICINDMDIGIASLWTSIIKYPIELKARIKSFKPSTRSFYELKDELTNLSAMDYKEEFVVDRGLKKIAIHQISYSGLGTMSGGPLGGKNQKSEYKVDCRWSPDFICKNVDKTHALFNKVEIDGGVCHCKDFEEILKNSKKNYLYYLDPPYYVMGGSLYQCSFNESDHNRLAKILSHINGSWILSYDDCKEIRKLYGDFCIEKVGVNYTIANSNEKSELIIHDRSK